jgi:hypothetical protein
MNPRAGLDVVEKRKISYLYQESGGFTVLGSPEIKQDGLKYSAVGYIRTTCRSLAIIKSRCMA